MGDEKVEDRYWRYQRRINYYETDQMKVVHHSNYIRYFEEARLSWMEGAGLSYCGIEQMGVIIPVMFVDCQYKSPVFYGDDIEILVRLTFFDGIKMEFNYEIYRKETGQLCTTGRSGHCFLDSEMKPIRLKRKHPDLYQAMTAALERDGGTVRKNF